MSSVCVVIPIHKKEPTAFELISIKQCYKVLENRPIFVVAPKDLNVSAYKNAVPLMVVIFIPAHWQSNLLSYNKLKYSRFFYNLFKDYDFLLTYEPDAFIFKDDLDDWCKKGYDYIGAPWFEGKDNPVSQHMIGVGNSGFSLRNSKKIRDILGKFELKLGHEYKNRLNLIIAGFKAPYRWFRTKLGENYMLQKYSKEFDDVFFSYTVPGKYPEFKIAPIHEALKFSFEVHPDYLYNLNNNELPTGCHAWWRYNFDFWKPFIEKEGYILLNN